MAANFIFGPADEVTQAHSLGLRSKQYSLGTGERGVTWSSSPQQVGGFSDGPTGHFAWYVPLPHGVTT